ncbi:manganese efflux pump [Candidatus Bathyarchaeota archaeon]|nr:manganese efflux pump [Candidatus Bathyarchaeota archaeon]
MDLITAALIATGLAFDAFAVSTTRGVVINSNRLQEASALSLSFSLFQVVMPFIGWLAGTGLNTFIQDFDHWIAFGLLSLTGFKMIYDSVKGGSKATVARRLTLPLLLVLSLATSIDALAVGVTLAFLRASITTPLLFIGSITFLLSFLGVYLGRCFGKVLDNKAEVAGGLILIGIGIKILLEHI